METITPRTHRLFLKAELEGVVFVLKEILTTTFRARKDFQTHEADVLGAFPFLEEIFTLLDKQENWNDLLSHPPYRVEVTLLSMSETDRKTFLRSPRDALTLFVALPPDCIQTKNRLLWGAEMPCRFHFVESDERPLADVAHYELRDIEYPFR